MIPGSTQHLVLFLSTAAFIAWSCVLISKIPKIFQTILITISVFVTPCAIFYRYAMGLSFGGELDLKALAVQMLQVCNFNFVLLPLMLIPKFKLIRQYVFYFSMFAACTTLVALSPSWATLEWYDARVLTSWIAHSFIVVCPLWFFAAGKLRPEIRFIFPVATCIFGYFTLNYTVCETLKKMGLLPQNQNFSYIYHAKGVPILEVFYNWIKLPYWHLLPAFGIMILFFCGLCAPFTRMARLHGNGIKKKRRIHATVRCPLKLSAHGFKREGYYLLGWSETPGGKLKYVVGEVITFGLKDIDLYAVWVSANSIVDMPKPEKPVEQKEEIQVQAPVSGS